jgi:hypothetical protein
MVNMTQLSGEKDFFCKRKQLAAGLKFFQIHPLQISVYATFSVPLRH